jgi:hypothetical protein
MVGLLSHTHGPGNAHRPPPVCSAVRPPFPLSMWCPLMGLLCVICAELVWEDASESVALGRFVADRGEVLGLIGQFLEDLGCPTALAALRQEAGLLPDARRAFMDSLTEMLEARRWQAVVDSLGSLPVSAGTTKLPGRGPRDAHVYEQSATHLREPVSVCACVRAYVRTCLPACDSHGGGTAAGAEAVVPGAGAGRARARPGCSSPLAHRRHAAGAAAAVIVPRPVTSLGLDGKRCGRCARAHACVRVDRARALARARTWRACRVCRGS